MKTIQGIAREERCIFHQSKRTEQRCRNRNKRLFTHQEAELWVLTRKRRGALFLKSGFWRCQTWSWSREVKHSPSLSLSGQHGTTDRTDSTRTSEYTNWCKKHLIPAYSLYKYLTRWKTACDCKMHAQMLWCRRISEISLISLIMSAEGTKATICSSGWEPSELL